MPRQPRVHVEIEIFDRRPPQRATASGYRLTLILLIVAVLTALAGCGAAHAQESSTSRRMGSVLYQDGTNADGSTWRGSSRRAGPVKYSDFTDNNGNVTRCTSHKMGSVVQTAPGRGPATPSTACRCRAR